MDKSDFVGLNSSIDKVNSYISESPVESGDTITYEFDNIKKGRFVSFVLDFSGAKTEEIYSYTMSRQFLYGDNAEGILEDQQKYINTMY